MRTDSSASGAKEEDTCLSDLLPPQQPGDGQHAQGDRLPHPTSNGDSMQLPTAGQPMSLGPQDAQMDNELSSSTEFAPAREQDAAPGFQSASQQANGEANREDDRDLDWVVWTSDDVADWVDLLLGDGMGERFRQNQIDGPTLLELTNEDLKVSLEMSNALHRQKVLGHVNVFQRRRARLAQQAARRRLAENSPRSSSICQDSPQNSYTPQPLDMQENGSSLHYAPPSRKQHGQGHSHSVDRLYPVSSISVNSRAYSSSELSSTTRCSRYINPSRMDTRGLTSYFGLDSPSNSVRGSWSTAPKKPDENRVGPGPCYYNVLSNSESASIKGSRPSATIGNSVRNTSEHFINPSSTRGGGKLRTEYVRPKTKGGVIGTSSRWAAAADRIDPGPASYRPRSNFLSTFK